ncbi:MAG: hypothetical protein IKW49_08130 [Opitutales bacterium]|nr:hypothetical protein [Opitutales bacterium]
MSGNVKIFLETGKKTTPEFVFVKTLLQRIGKPVADDNIVCLGGWTTLEKIFAQQSQKPDVEKILIVFDADYAQNGGGFASRRKELEGVINGSSKAKLFLFPNNSDDGDFETLLNRIVNLADNERFFDCFSDFEKCLGGAYLHPNLKAKLYSYINLQKEFSTQERDRLGRGEWLFEDKRFWDLDHPALDALKIFFKGNL